MYSVILAAVDDSPRAEQVVEAALDLAERFDARVHLFRSVSVPPAFPPAAVTPPDELPAQLATEARRSLEALAGGHPRIVVETPDLRTPHPWEAIVVAARRIGADLIVIGSHGYGGWDRLLGTNAAKVADRADRSVLVVHEAARPAA